MTHRDTPTPDPLAPGFESRLLASILEDYDELTAPAAARPTGRDRRKLPRPRAGHGWGVPALAAAGVAALLLLDTGAHTAPPPRLASGSSDHLDPGQRVLFRLAAESLSVPAVTGRYAVLSEVDTDSDDPGVQTRRTSVDDTQTGAYITYQTGSDAGTPVPAVVSSGPYAQQTASYFDSLPTNPTALAAVLLATARKDDATATAGIAADYKANSARNGDTNPGPAPSPGPTPTDDEFIYQQADTMLWSPVVGPALRAALYKVIASCSGVHVNPHASTPDGRPAIEISESDPLDGTSATYEDPSTGAVLAQVSHLPTGDVLTDEYRPVTSSNTIPADPYTNG